VSSARDIERRYYFIQFLYWFATGLPLALTVLLLQARGLDLFEIGIVMAIYSVVIVLLELPTGGLADAIGRKPVTLMAYGFITIYSLILFFAFSFEAFVLAYVIYGIGRALSSGALDAWFLDALKQRDEHVEIQPRLATATTFILLGLGLGTLLGGAIASLFAFLPDDGTAILTPSAVPVLLAVLLKLVLLLATFLLIKEDHEHFKARGIIAGVRAVPGIIGSGFSLLKRNRILIFMLLATGVNGLFIVGLENLWQPRFDTLLGDREGERALLGVIMGATFLVGIGGNLLSTLLGRLLKRRYAIVGLIAQLLKFGAILTLALLVHPVYAAIAFWMCYYAAGIGNSPQATLVNEEIPSEQRSSMMSVYSLMAYVGSIGGSLIFGFVAENISIQTAWIMSSVVVLISCWLFVLADRERQVKRVDAPPL